MCLIKPQFEAGREKVGKKGVVREKSVHEEVIVLVMNYAISIGFEPLQLDYSPIKGPEGNIEYLLYIKKNSTKVEELETKTSQDGEEEIHNHAEMLLEDHWMTLIKETVEKSHELL